MIGTDLFKRMANFVARFFPRFCITSSDEGSVAHVWREGSWRVADFDASLLRSPFRQVVWLIPEDRVLYRVRGFPVDMVKKSDLTEAVTLDLNLWSPFGEKSSFFFWPVLKKDEWLVSIWVWDGAAEVERQSEHESISPFLTHIMPEQAWRFTTAAKLGPAVLVWQRETIYTYGYIGEANAPGKISHVCDKRGAQHYWRSLGGLADKVKTILLFSDDGEAPWLPPGVERMVQVKACLPSAEVMSNASMPGSRDWRDPFAWKSQLITIVFLFAFWVVGSSAVIWKGEDLVHKSAEQARLLAGEVIDHRNDVSSLDSFLVDIYGLREQQYAVIQLITDLSVSFPEESWLLSLEYEGTEVSIRGQGKDVVRLAPLLENIPGIVHVEHKADITPDLITGLDIFFLRLKLGEERDE